uniref:Retropepsins domain-containing protein n=1 Tax=Photinus pyralis TaxID=7054 RepID=A0A1Y1NJJ9_PHOPY
MACKKKGHIKPACPLQVGKFNRNNFVVELNTNDDLDEQSETEEDLFSVSMDKKTTPIIANVVINGVNLNMEIDTGSGISIISEKTYQRYFNQLLILDTKIKLRSYTREEIKTLGYIKVDVDYQKRNFKDLNLYIVYNGGPPLLGRDWLSKLNITIGNDFLLNNVTTITKHSLLNDFSELFEESLGTLRGFKAKLHLKEAGTSIL